MNYVSRPAWRNQWLSITVLVLLFLLSIVMFIVPLASEQAMNILILLLFPTLFLILGAATVYRHYCWRFTIGDDTVESHYGIIARNVKSIRIKDLRNINLRQSLFQRIFGIGDLEFSSAGGAEIEVTFFGIQHPMDIKQKVQILQGEQ